MHDQRYPEPCPLYPGGLGMTRPGETVYIRPDQIGDPHGPKTAAEFFNTAAFAEAVGHFGSSRPGAILGPGIQVWDMSLIKNYQIRRTGRSATAA